MTEPNQQASQSSDERLGQFAKGVFESLANPDQDIEQHDEAVQGDGVPAAGPEEGKAPKDETENRSEEEQAASEEENPQVSDVAMVEVELEDGKKVMVPEYVKGHLMRDKDYRQKTMALAEQRKSYEQLSQQARQIADQAQQMAPYHAHLFVMDNRASQLNKELTQELAVNDPIEYNRKQGELAILLRNRDSLASGLHQQMSRLYQEQAELKSKQLAIEAPKLFEEIPELQKTEEREALGKWVKDQGLTEDEFQYLNFSVAGTRLAWKARQFDRMVKEQAKVKASLKDKVQTIPAVTKTSRSAESGAIIKQQRQEWKKGGGKLHDENFSALLRSRGIIK